LRRLRARNKPFQIEDFRLKILISGFFLQPAEAVDGQFNLQSKI
jgi:hypothetical protein